MANSYLLFLTLSLCATAQAFEIEVTGDLRSAGSRRIQIVCAAFDLDEDLESCEWISPQGEKYTDRDGDRNYEVTLDDEECTLEIRRATDEDNGPWRCVLEEEDNSDEETAYAFVQVASDSGGVVENEELMREELTVGKSGSLTCPVSAKGRRKTFRCTWTDRFGNDYNAASRYDGITFDVDISRGECVMNIDKVTSYHVGKWKCQILTDRSDGRIGSQSYSSSVMLRDKARFRTKRLNDEDTLQGNKEGDDDVVVTMKVPASDDEKSVEFYWIVQRKYKIDEGDEECPDDECYESSKPDLVRGDGGEEEYEIELQFEELQEEDVTLPVMLVKEFRKRGDRRGQKYYQMYRVTSDSPEEASSEEGCVINGDFIEVDDAYEDDDLCVKIECIAAGAVEVDELRNC